MPQIEALRSDKLPPPVGPFSLAVRSGGFIFFSGQVGVEPSSGALVAGGVEAEARQLFANLATLLDTAGKSFADVVKANVYLTDIGDFAAVNAIYARHSPSLSPRGRRSRSPRCHWAARSKSNCW